jgi:cytochrome b
MQGTDVDPAQVKVWDLLVRICHWAIVAGFVVAYLTEDGPLTLHAWAGYTVGAVVVLRILWGFVGPRHARFSDFLYGPGRIFGYLADLARLRGTRYLGHSPAGGAMVIVLLAGLAATVWSGLEVYADQEGAGPLAAVTGTAAVADRTAAPLVLVSTGEKQGGAERQREESAWKEVHETLANFTLFLVVLHIIGVLWASIAHRENLVWSMVTGVKRAR